MAEIVAGFASSHTALMSEPGENWLWYANEDQGGRLLVRPRDGKRVPYQELLAEADPEIAKQVDVSIFQDKYETVQKAMDELQDTFAEVNPDVVVMFGDDQEELFFDDNYPMINVYYGETLTHYPWLVAHPNLTEPRRSMPATTVYGDEVIHYPVETNLGQHIVAELSENDFDVAQSRYLKDTYGGSVGPGTWYLDKKKETKPRRAGMAHAYAFPVCRWFAGKRPPMVPITINTCYPPNWISPRRAFALGRAVREAILSWESDARVAIVTSGGLSHFVVDEEIDRLALEGLTKADANILSTLPREKLQSATTEILNWVAAAGAMGEVPMELMTYLPGYRTAAGSGCGLAVGRWLP